MSEKQNQAFEIRGLSHKIFPRKVFTPGAVIFRKGEAGLHAFIVLRGEVEILGRGGADKITRLATIGAGELFGEQSLLNHSKRTASALTTSGCELLIVDQKQIEQKLDKADPFLRAWINILSDKIVELSKRVS